MSYRRIIRTIFTISFLFNISSDLFSTSFYVSPQGSDSNSGTESSPFKTIEKAKITVRQVNDNMTEDITVYLKEGTYSIENTLLFTEEDGGTNGYTIHYQAYADDEVIVSGGREIETWSQYDGNIYVADLTLDHKLRQLYVDGKRCYMAKGDNVGHSDGEPWGTFTISGTESWALGAGSAYDGASFDNTFLASYNNPNLVELSSHSGFAHHTVGIREISEEGDQMIAKFQQPMGAIAATTPEAWGCGFYKNLYGPERKFHFQNAFELLDEEGEFYFDVPNQKLYYYKRESEDMNTAEVIAPIAEGLISIKGNSLTERVQNISFSNISFLYDHFPLMEVDGSYGASTVQSVALQTKFHPGGNWHETTYTNLSTQDAAIEVENAAYISFNENKFKFLGAMGINFGNDVSESTITCSEFYDIGSSAINVGDAHNTYIGDGDIDVSKEGVPTNNLIMNNHISYTGQEYIASPSISVFWTENCQIISNKIEEVPACAISLGWGWVDYTEFGSYTPSTISKNNKINNNIVHRTDLILHDAAAIYTLGAQPGSEIIGNHISDVVNPTAGNAIYLDQGTSGMTIEENVCERFAGKWFYVWGRGARVADITLQNNYADRFTDYGINNLWTSTVSNNFTTKTDDVTAWIGNAGIAIECNLYEEVVEVFTDTIVNFDNITASFPGRYGCEEPIAVANPFKDNVNSSDYVGKYVLTDGNGGTADRTGAWTDTWPSAIPFSSSEYPYLKIKIYTSEPITIAPDLSGENNAAREYVFQNDEDLNKWVELCFDYSVGSPIASETITNFVLRTFGGVDGQVFYFDDVVKSKTNDPISSTNNDHLTAYNLKIHPNPSNGIFNINLLEETEVNVYSMDMKVIYNSRVKEGQLNLENLRKGIYFIQFNNHIEKVIIN